MIMHQFEKNIISIYGDKGKAWLVNLPTQIQRIATLWKLDDLHPFNNLTHNYVLEGYQKNKPIILKLSLDELALSQEAKALQVFADFGAVQVLGHTSDALLLQRALPGNLLKNLFLTDNSSALKIACDVAKQLHQAPIPKENSFPHIKDWLMTLDKEWDIPSVYLKKARALKNTLLKTQNTTVLLHGDLHRENILSDGKDWLIIDPKGVIGFPINEVWALVEDPKNDLLFISKYFDFNLSDVISWYYVHLVLAACFQVEDHLDPELFLNLAETVASMM